MKLPYTQEDSWSNIVYIGSSSAELHWQQLSPSLLTMAMMLHGGTAGDRSLSQGVPNLKFNTKKKNDSREEHTLVLLC